MPMISFERIAMPDPAVSMQSGYPGVGEGIRAVIQIDSKNNLHLEMLAPRDGEPRESFLRRVDPEIRANWMPQLDAWLAGQTVVDGTPLENMAWVTPAMVTNLRNIGLNSVEGLANASDGILSPLGMNATTMRNQARAWLEERAGKAVSQVGELSERNAVLEGVVSDQNAVIAQMQQQLAELAAKMNQPQDAQEPQEVRRPGPGRPPKNKE